MATGQTLWSIPREEYDRLYGSDKIENFQPLRFPLRISDAEIAKALHEDEEERVRDEEEKLANIGWFGITRSVG